MSEERGKRDDESPGTAGDDASTSDSSAPETSTDGVSDATAARPTGKRTTRRARTSTPATSPEPVSVTKAATSRSSTATREKSREPARMNIFKRLRKFFREVVAELRKVIWPNKKQMVTYTSVVLVFVTFMVAYISGLDLAFIRGVEWLFG